MQNVITTNQKKKRKGFTLIELIIVLAVMAIIAAIAIPNFASVSKNSKNKADVQSMETIKRIVLTKIAESDVEEKSYTLTFEENGDLDKDSAGDLAEALKEVKAPKVDGKDQYVITITDGDVKVGYEAPTTTP